VIAGLERDVRGRATRIGAATARVGKRLDLRMCLTATMVPAFTERGSVAHEDASDGRIRRGIGDGARRQLAGAREVGGVAVYGRTSTPFQNAT
jgi:hypothetical protein